MHMTVFYIMHQFLQCVISEVLNKAWYYKVMMITSTSHYPDNTKGGPQYFTNKDISVTVKISYSSQLFIYHYFPANGTVYTRFNCIEITNLDKAENLSC